MFFVNDDYDNYHYLVEVHDNYVILSSSSSISGSYLEPDSVPCIYQFFYPSTQVIESYYTSYNTTSFDSVTDQMTDDFYYRSDASNIIFTGGLFLFFALFIVSIVTSVVHKGGILFDS